jgi:hypothetical protein
MRQLMRQGRLQALLAACALAVSALAVSFAAPVARAAAPLVTATIAPSTIALGESAQLTITTSGSSMAPVNLPTVSGLEFRIVGQSQRIELVHGATLMTTALLVRVTPDAVGIYTIPGLTPASQPLVLRVNPDNGAGRFGGAGQLNGTAKPPSGAPADGIRMTADGAAFIRLILPKRDVYVGESVPVGIEVGMRDGFVSSVNGLPTLLGSDFTLNNLSHQPERVRKTIDGKDFTVLTWHSVLAAVKPGTYSLAVESPITVRIRTRPQRESTLEDMLGDPFMQNFFGATVPKDITVSSPPSDLTVLSLPAEGRPPGFSGAVGSFKIASELSATTAAAGDPLELRLHITGAGNFDRVDSPMLEHLDAWKTYPPKSSFKASDALADKGEKIFEQPLIAAEPGTQTLPGLAFSYFDPGTRRYETARTAPLTVTISPSVADRSQRAPATAGASVPGPGPAGARDPNAARDSNAAAGPNGDPAMAALHPDHPQAEPSASSLEPLYLRPYFLLLPSLLALAAAGGWLRLRRRTPEPAAARRRPRWAAKASQRIVLELQSAARTGNAALFFNRARAALLPMVAGLDTEHEDIRQLFALADEAIYSGHPLNATDYDRWTEIVHNRLVQQQPST